MHGVKVFPTELMFLKLNPQLCPLCSEECISSHPHTLPSYGTSALAEIKDSSHQSIFCEETCLPEVAPTVITALNVCQAGFQSLLACADSHQRNENQNICSSFQPLELLKSINMRVAQSDLNAAVSN